MAGFVGGMTALQGARIDTAPTALAAPRTEDTTTTVVAAAATDSTTAAAFTPTAVVTDGTVMQGGGLVGIATAAIATEGVVTRCLPTDSGLEVGL